MKKNVSLLLCLALFLVGLSACAIESLLPNRDSGASRAETEGSSQAAPRFTTPLYTFSSTGITYYCWEDSSVTTSSTYREDSNMYWYKDSETGACIVENAHGLVAKEEIVVPTEDLTQGHQLAGIVTDPASSISYYCWDDGVVTTTDTYGESGMCWTNPWGQKFFNIYNGPSDNGNVLYSEKACSWCGSHKTYYLSYVLDYNSNKVSKFLCESCHVDLVSTHKKCCVCGSYDYSDRCFNWNNQWYCVLCY